MDMAITKMSSKGQIVIPLELREGIKEGDKLVVIRDGNQLLLKRMQDMPKRLQEDLEFARRTEEAWKRYDKGEFKSMSAEEFLKKLEKR